MDSISNTYLYEHKQFRIKNKKLAFIFPLLAVIIAIIVFWWLKLTGITITGDAFCGLSEHTHSGECYSVGLVCGLTDAADETGAQPHSHSELCYGQTLVCTVPEHTHSAECFPDVSADTETVSDWLKTFEDIKLTNEIPENLCNIAMTQKGYTESSLNFEYDEQGNKKGYTRYGEWYGNPYADWNTLFVAFCINYSNINNSDPFENANAESMKNAFIEKHIYSPEDSYEPQKGDIVFFDTDADDKADRTAIVISTGSEGILVIEGDVNNSVDTVHYQDRSLILGFCRIAELYAAHHVSEEQTEEIESTASQDNKPQQSTEENTSEKNDNLSSVSEPQINISDMSEPVLMFANGAPEPNITYIEDLTLALTGVVFKTEDGEVLDDGSTVYVGQTYIVSLEFAEDNTGTDWLQFQHNDAHILHYQIPEYLHCEPFDSWHPITARTENGTIEEVGEYFVDEHGYLRVRFIDDENGVCFGSKYSNVDFVIDFNAYVGENLSGTNTEIKFNDKIDINLNVDGGADMTVTKTHGTYDSDNHTMEYTIKVEATKGVVSDLVIDDQIWENHYVLRDTIVVTDLDGNIIDPQPVVSDHPKHNSGADEGFRISGFPDFSAGNGFLIKYKTQVYDNMLGGDTVDMWNGLDTNGKNSDGENIYKWTEDWLRVELEKLEKDGRQSVLQDTDGNDIPVIEWEVEIKKDNHNLKGTVVIDTLGNGLSYYTGKDIRVKCYDEGGNRLPDVYISWNDVTINGNSMEFSLPDGYAFDIIYYTRYEDLAEGEMKNYTNSVSAVINGKQETTGGAADVVGFIPHVTKSASGNDGKFVYFTIEAEVPSVIQNWGNFYLTDLTAFWGYKENGASELYVQNIPQDLIITAVTNSGQTVTFTPYVEGGPIENTYILVAPSLEDGHHSFNILFNTSEKNLALSKWILDEDAKLTVTYKLPFDSKTGQEWSGELTGDKTLEDVLLGGYSLANEVYFNYTDVIQGQAGTNYEYSPQITKESVVNEDGTIDYTVVFHNTVPGSYGNQGYVNAQTNNMYFNDTFDEKMEYVPGSLTVTCYDPWRDGLWMNKYTYNGTVQGNEMNIPADQIFFSETNPDAAAVGWGSLHRIEHVKHHYSYVNAGGDYVFTYKLKIKDEYRDSVEENILYLDNTAEITWDNGGTTGPVTDESEFNTGLLDKHVVQENNKLKFDIHVNANAHDILPGTDKLTIDDTMSSELSVYWASIKLYYEDANGNWIDFDSDGSAYKYTVTFDQTTNKLTFVVPDELHIRIDYTTLITQSGYVSVNNSVSIDGKAQVSDIIDAIFKVEEHSGGASGSIHNITLIKQDGTTNAPLQDVTLHMYGPMGDPHATLPDGVTISITTDKNETLYYIGSYTTGTDGTVIIETQYLTLGGPYALVEKAPPEGYLPLDKPTYFYFYELDSDGIVQTVTTIVTVANYNYGFVFPETGGMGTFPLATIGISLIALPVLYSIIRRKRERRLY